MVFREHAKIEGFWPPGLSWGSLGALLELSWGSLGALLGLSQALSGSLGALLGLSWALLGLSWALFVLSWGSLGNFLGALLGCAPHPCHAIFCRPAL